MNLKTRISNKGFIYLALFMILFSYFESPYLNTIGTISRLYNFGKVISCMLFILLLINNKKLVVPNYIIIVVIYNIYLFMRSLYLGLPIFNVLNKVMTSITFFVFIDYFVKYYTKEFYNSLFYVLFILVTINFILMIKYKYGIYNIDDYNRSYWLLGHVNNMPVFLYPAIIVSLMKLQSNSIFKKISSILLLTISIFSILYGKSATSIIGFLIIAFYVIIKSTKLSLIHYYLISLIFFTLIVVLSKEYKFMYYISMFFNRSITFTGRTNIWDHVLYYIEKKPFLGYGLETPLMTMAKFNFITPHNRYLYILYTGGLLGFSLFTYFVLNIWRLSINDYKKYSNNIIYRSLHYTCCAIFIIFQMETYVGVLIYLPFILLVNVNSEMVNFCNVSQKGCIDEPKDL